MFWITLAALLFAAIMNWLNDGKKWTVGAVILWIIGFFSFPILFGSGWPFLSLQALLALILLLRWKLDDVTGRGRF